MLQVAGREVASQESLRGGVGGWSGGGGGVRIPAENHRICFSMCTSRFTSQPGYRAEKAAEVLPVKHAVPQSL